MDFDMDEDGAEEVQEDAHFNMKEFGSGSMADPLRHAAGLRSHYDETKMRMWNSFPSFFQNTIFHGEKDPTIKALRHGGPLAERLARAEEEKGQGTAQLKAAPGGPAGFGALEGAKECYERAAGVLRYVECTRPDWKNDDGSYKGIEDQHLQVDASALEGGSEDAERARILVASCYLNIALVAHKLKQYELMLRACTAVLDDVDPKSVKALYRRAQARTENPASREDDERLAVADLRAALQLAPQDREVREFLARLRGRQQRSRAKEQKGFAGLFERGDIIEGDGTAQAEAAAERERASRPPLDLRDPKVQAFLDVRPGPDSFK